MNITPDEETGIGLWTEDIFVDKFQSMGTPEARHIKPDSMGYQSIMPWTMYSGMTERDLGAIYQYLRSIKPVKNAVEKYTSSK